MQQITGPWRGWWQHLWIGCSDSTIATHSNGTITTQFADLPKSNVVPPDACHTSMSGNGKAIAIVEKCGGAKDLGDGTLIRYFVIVVGQRMFVGAAHVNGFVSLNLGLDINVYDDMQVCVGGNVKCFLYSNWFGYVEA